MGCSTLRFLTGCSTLRPEEVGCQALEQPRGAQGKLGKGRRHRLLRRTGALPFIREIDGTMLAVDQPIDADVDAIAIGQQGPGDGTAIEQRAIAAAEVLDDHVLQPHQQHGVFAGDGEVVQHEGIGGPAANGGTRQREPVGTQRAACHRQGQLSEFLCVVRAVLMISTHPVPLTSRLCPNRERG